MIPGDDTSCWPDASYNARRGDPLGRRVRRRPGRSRQSRRWYRKPLDNFVFQIKLIPKSRDWVHNGHLSGKRLIDSQWISVSQYGVGSHSPGRIPVNHYLLPRLSDTSAIGERLNAFRRLSCGIGSAGDSLDLCGKRDNSSYGEKDQAPLVHSRSLDGSME